MVLKIADEGRARAATIAEDTTTPASDRVLLIIAAQRLSGDSAALVT